ncbi:OmpA family protein [Ponticoccus alexandrii]|uniref:OmpA family protein n=1 Tax=Ponticoccus alexandrii TaxID=1943633 RepID=A0ABX7F7S6_9RHOB|nr:OmpA family protein [Ponticoccus alexandrii]ETA52406.1 membrane protein [Rhodobacteraceae bacterium PD-2]QRF65412.1 OmpA family protein [Ponticoccus alexandrii]
MRLSTLFTIGGTFTAAGAISLVAAYFSAQMVESASVTSVLNELDSEGLTWAEVDTNGLQVFLIGTAPDEAARFQALSTAGRVVDASRVIDQMLVEEPEDLAPPYFSLEILRNDAGISVIGLVPTSTDREALMDSFHAAADGVEVSDLLESADFPAPDGWDDALRFATAALHDLPRSKISIDAERVEITAMTDSAAARSRIETALTRRKPEDLRLALDLSAPRPVISPFALRFLIDENGARFDACSADTEATRDRILRAATGAGLEDKATCTLGLGAPSRRWADATELAISKLAELGQGSVTFSNADIALVAAEGTDEATFDRVVGELQAALPEVFALHATLTKPPEAQDDGPIEFIATLSPEGRVQMRGRLSSDSARTTMDSFAKARFGSENVYTAARVAENMPQDWPVRTLAGLETLATLANGSVTVTPDGITVRGKTGNADADAEIAALLADKMGEDVAMDISVEYVERLDPTLGLPSPEECEAQIVQTIGARKISFEPGAATLDASAEEIMDELAELLKRCGDIPLEIGGHTDSQGRESMNQELSRDRAQAVLDALRTRLVPVKSYTVRGYGEETPIADNGTEAGREENRRIEFKLLKIVAEEGQEGDEPADGDAPDPESDEPAETGETDVPAEGPADEQR